MVTPVVIALALRLLAPERLDFVGNARPEQKVQVALTRSKSGQNYTMLGSADLGPAKYVLKGTLYSKSGDLKGTGTLSSGNGPKNVSVDGNITGDKKILHLDLKVPSVGVMSFRCVLAPTGSRKVKVWKRRIITSYHKDQFAEINIQDGEASSLSHIINRTDDVIQRVRFSRFPEQISHGDDFKLFYDVRSCSFANGHAVNFEVYIVDFDKSLGGKFLRGNADQAKYGLTVSDGKTLLFEKNMKWEPTVPPKFEIWTGGLKAVIEYEAEDILRPAGNPTVSPPTPPRVTPPTRGNPPTRPNPPQTPVPPRVNPPATAPRFTEIRGSVQVFNGAAGWQPLTSSTLIRAGTEIRVPAGGIATLSMPNGTKVELTGGTTIAVVRLTPTGMVLSIRDGQVNYDHPGGSPGDWQIVTDYLSAVPLGTKFSFAYDKLSRNHTVQIQDGKVKLKPLYAGADELTFTGPTVFSYKEN